MDANFESVMKGQINLSRREFLKLSAVVMGGAALNSLLGEWWDERNPNLEPFKGRLAEYKVGWNARPWVWTNLALASQKIDGLVIKPGEEISLVKAMGLDKSINTPDQNTDPRVGYVAAQMSDFEKLSGIGYGLCLASTTVFRAALNSPLRITERGTHYDIYSDYFRDMPVGTDAAVYYPGPGDKLPETDLKLLNPTDKNLVLRYRVYDASGIELHPPGKELSLLEYKASYIDQVVRVLQRRFKIMTGKDMPEQFFPQYMFGNKRIISRAVITAGEPIDFLAKMSGVSELPTKANGQDNYAFSRTLEVVNGGRKQVYNEDFVSQYGESPIANATQLSGN